MSWAARLPDAFTVRAKHFLQEEQAAIADRVALLARFTVTDGRLEVSSGSA